MGRIIDGYCRLLDALIALALAVMVVLVFGNVVLRYGFNSGITVSEEVSRCRVGRETIVADAVVYPRMTPLLAAAEQRGCFVQPGAYMMDTQMALQAEFFGFESGDWSPQAIAKALG